MGSAWVEHVKSVYAKGKKKGMSYKEAMQKAKVSWAKKKGGAAAKAPAKKGKKKKAAEETDDEKAEVAEKKPKRQKKKAGRGLEDQESTDVPQSSKKARSSRASRKTKKASVQRKDVAPKGLPGMGAPFKQ